MGVQAMDFITISKDIENFDFKNLESQGLEKQLELLDDYLSDNLYNLSNRKLQRDSLKRVINTWDEDKKIKVVDIYIERRPYKIASIIDWFDIKDDKVLQNIAIKIAKKGGYLAKDITKFNIKDELTKIELAKECLKNEASDFIYNVDKFEILDRKALVELARESMKSLSVIFAINFKKFNIQDEETRIEFAKEMLYDDIKVLTINIGNFDIKRQDVLKEFAYTIVKRTDGENLAKYIDKFKLQDEEDRIKIAKIIAKNGKVRDISKFNISNKKALLDILETLAITNVNTNSLTMTLDHFKLDNIKDIKFIFNILVLNETSVSEKVIILRRYKEKLLELKGKEKDTGILESIDNLRLFYTKKSKDKETIYFDIQKLLGRENAKEIMDIIDSQKEERTKKASTEIVEKILFMLDIDEELQKNKDEVKKLIVEIISIRNLKLKSYLMPLIAKMLNEGKLDKISQEMKVNNKKKAYPAINAVIFDKLNLYDDEKLIKNIQYVFSLNSFLKDSKSVYSVLLGLIRLDNTYLTSSGVKDILTFVFRHPKEIKNNMRFISLIISFEEVERLEYIKPSSDANIIKEMFYDIYNSYLNIHDKNFIDNYERFISDPRNMERNLEENIMIYVAKRNKDYEVMEMMRKFILNMHDLDAFRRERYSKETSEHLKALDEAVYNKWIGDEYNEQGLENNRTIISDDPVDLFLLGTEVEGSCQNVRYEGDLNACLMGYVMDGKNKVAEIKNKQGKILARCIVRLLIENGTNDVVMLREKMYTATDVDDSILDEINERCIDYAKYLGVSLVCDDILNEETKERFSGVLESKKGQVPYEYVDSIRGVCTGAEGYEVEGWSLLYLYKNK